MYKPRKKIYFALINASVLLLSTILSVLLVTKETPVSDPWFYILIPAVVFLGFLVVGSSLRHSVDKRLHRKYLETGETSYIEDFIDKLRFCYSYDDLYQTISESLEMKADCSVLFVNREKNYVLYNSPSRISASSKINNKLAENYPENWKDGFYFIGEKLGIISSSRKARGFFLCYNKHQFFVFNRYTHLFDNEIYDKLYEEYVRFLSRTRIISDLSEISSLTKEW